jgi:amino acid adenylation domain-containing protein
LSGEGIAMTHLIKLSIHSHPTRPTEPWNELSSAQRGLWLAYTLRPETHADYNLSLTMRMRPAIEPERLRRALERLASNHPMLRARFCEIDGQPMQKIHSSPIAALRVVEVVNLDSEEVAALERADRMRPIDVTTEPPFRATLYTAGTHECVMGLVFDHLVADGWSLFQLTQELGEIIETGGTAAAEDTGRTPEYFEYVKHEQQWLSTPRATKQLDYWSETLTKAQPGVDLRRDFRPGEQRERASVELILSSELRSALVELSAKHGTTLFATLMAAYVLLLHRLSGEEQVSVGSVMPTRRDNWKKTTGNFVNPVVMPVTVRSEMTLPELLKSVHDLAFRTLKNKEYPFEELIERIKPRGSNRGAAYFKAFYAFQKARHAPHMAPIVAHSKALGPTRWAGFEVEVFGDYLVSGSGGQDLTLETCDFGECIFSGWNYDARRFARSTIEAFANRWQDLLRSMVEHGAQPVSRLSWLPADERQRVVVDWNAAAARLIDPQLFHEQFETHVERAPDAVAVRYETLRVSYAELNARANQLASHLRALGVRPDTRIGIFMERSVELIVAVLATLKAGGAFVPLDPAYPAERLRHMIDDSAPLAVLTSGTAHTKATELAASLQIVNLDADGAAWANAPTANLSAADVGLRPEHLAYVIYTSGSTGTPKGVMNEHRGLINLAGAQSCFDVDRSSRILQFASPSFDASVWEIAMALSHGASLQLARRAELMPGRPLLETMARGKITHVTLPPSALPMCEDPELPFTPTTLIVAGEAIRAGEASKWAARLALFNAYGPSETTVCATVHRCHPGADLVPIGRPIANARIYILDDARQPVPVGTTGEIYIGGAPVGRGYLNRAALTTERFLEDPFSEDTQARMYKTGDLGRWLADGSVEYLGRNDSQVKLRGFRIELDEIVAVLSGVEGVADVVVVVREDAPDDKRLVAYYCGAHAPNAETLRAHAVLRLPDYMVPAAYVRLDAFPVTPNGKVDRKALAAPNQQAYVVRSYQAPRGRFERVIAKIWEDVLKHEQVGRHDNFFELGGHSLQVVAVVSRVQRELSIRVPVKDLFSHPVLAGFARAAKAARERTSQSNLVSLRPRGSLRPLFGVHPIGGTVEYLRRLASRLDPQLPLYGLEASGWDADDAPPPSISAIAERYVAALRSAVPEGPYRLLGYSVGGVIAYAMAETLLEQGAAVEFLGVIDSHPNLGVSPEYVDTVKRMNRAEAEGGPEAADRVFLHESLRYVAPAHTMNVDAAATHRAVRVMRATMQALCHYQPRKLPVQVTLFAATDDASFDLDAEWSAFMPGRVQTIPVKGNHLNIIDPHNISGLGHAITAALALKRKPVRPFHPPFNSRMPWRSTTKVGAHARTVA